MSLTPDLAALALAVVVVPTIVAILLATAHHFSPKSYGKYTHDNYECGEVPIGDFKAPLPLQYYFFVMAFVIFDVDFLLLLPWAGSVKALGIGVFVDVILFIAIMLSGLFYAVRKGYMRWLNV
jgi:NADH-quinone oxidoreductase subunit A